MTVASAVGLPFFFGAELDHALSRLGLSMLEERIYLTLLAHRNPRTGQCNPSVPLMARLRHRSERSVQYALNRLEALGLIYTQWRKGGRSVTTQWEFGQAWWFRLQGQLQSAEVAEEKEVVSERAVGSPAPPPRASPPVAAPAAPAPASPVPDAIPRPIRSDLPPGVVGRVKAIWEAAWASSALGQREGPYQWPMPSARKDQSAHAGAAAELVGLRAVSEEQEEVLRAAFDQYLEAESHPPTSGREAGSRWGVWPRTDPASLPKFAQQARRWLDQGRQSARQRAAWGSGQGGGGPGPPGQAGWQELSESLRQQILRYHGAQSLTPDIEALLQSPGYLEYLVELFKG